MKISIPKLSLVILVGASGSGKSTFAKKHFEAYEVVSSDVCRGIVSNDENNQAVSNDAFELLYYIIRKRLKNGLLTVVDATNVQPEARKGLVKLAREYHVLPVVIVLDLPQKVCEERNEQRSDRNFGNHVIRYQKQQLKRSLRGLKREGFRKIHIFKSQEEIDALEGIIRDKLYNDKQELTGPFDIIGDIHGCYDELKLLLEKLGYQFAEADQAAPYYGVRVAHPEGRTALFLGDLTDRGPKSPEVLKLVMSMVYEGNALCVCGNHDSKLQRRLKGKNVNLKHGLAETMEQLGPESDEFKDEVREFLYSLVSHYVLDNGRLVIAHAGIKEEMQGRGSGAVRSFCMYGETTGEIDEFGLPVRYNWAAEYRGQAKVVYGHTPVPRAEWFNRTIDIDTGCVFGGKLTALRYPEEELVEVEALELYCVPKKPLDAVQGNGLTHQQDYDDLLNIEDVIGKRIIQTRLRHNLTIREENSIAALETMSRFAINPKWLIYLPPTMSPCATSDAPDFLEHPKQAINYYRKRGIKKVVCEEKHMGSRAVIVLCRNEAVALERFGIEDEGIGVCYTRTGRSFFNDKQVEQAFLQRLVTVLDKADFWEDHQTNWVCLDTELMPWSAKAQALLKDQYASVGASAKYALKEVVEVLAQAQNRGLSDAVDYLEDYKNRQASITRYTQAYRNYCWNVTSLDDYKLAPFHILATESGVHIDQNHEWHMTEIQKLCTASDGWLQMTNYKIVDTTSDDSIQEAIDWWMVMTEKGGEGMVVKSYDFITYGKEGLLQPAVKCRGKEYLRIIYGAEYDHPKTLKRLKRRGLSKKRSLALREFALGVEGLERFVRKEPLRRVHESIFAVLALESEEVDPRL